MFRREELTPEEYGAVSRKIRRKIIFIEKIIYNGKLKKLTFL